MEITVDLVRALRNESGAGIMDSKRALEQADGDLERARSILQEKGLASAAKKSGRATHEGLVEAYIHSGSRVGALVEVNCETDFVARTDDFKGLAHDIAMQVAAMAPLYLEADDVPEADGVDPQEACLMQQPFIKDPTKTVQELVTEVVARLGENVQVRRFKRFALGE